MRGGASWAQSPCPAIAVLLVLLLVTPPPAAAACANPATFTDSAVSITKHFSEAERKKDSALSGIRGTARFLSPQTLMTAAHVAQAVCQMSV